MTALVASIALTLIFEMVLLVCAFASAARVSIRWCPELPQEGELLCDLA